MTSIIPNLRATLFAVISLASCPALADNLPHNIEKIKLSVVGIGTLEQTRRPPISFRGTGFVVGDGLHIITNAHVIPPVLDVEQQEKLGILVGQGEVARFREAKQVAIDTEHDLTLLKIEGEPLTPVKFGDSGTLREGQNIAFTGFPIGTVLGLYPVTHRGTVSAITPIVIPAASSKTLDAKSVIRMRTPYTVFQLDATAYPGNSGSPMYDPDTGALYGIINMVFVKSTKENALADPSGISYAIPAKYILDMLNKAGLKP
jgi:serine protease Do